MGRPGDTIVITGTNFNSLLTANVVKFGATNGQVISASTTSLSVRVDTGATYAPVYFYDTTTHKSCFQNGFFMPVFTDSFFIPNSVNFLTAPTSFATSTITSPYTAVIGDLNGDGKPDLAVNARGVAGANPGLLFVYRNVSTPGTINGSSFASPDTLSMFAVGNQPTNIKIADMDLDGKPDLVVSLQSSSRIAIYRNTSTGTTMSFAPGVIYSENHVGKSPNVIAIADFDGDGRPDVAVSSKDTNNFVVFRNLSTPGVINTTSMDTPRAFRGSWLNFGICAADLDHDSRPDIVMVDDSVEKAWVFRNISTGPGNINFAAADTFGVGVDPADMQLADINGDGKTDLLVANTTFGTLSVLQNLSTGPGSLNFATKVDFVTDSAFAATYSASSLAVGVAAGDMDGDGKVDVVVSNAGSGNISVFRNNGLSGTITSGSLSRPFMQTVGGNPVSLNIGDLDGDGYPDIVAGQYFYNHISIVRNYPLPFIAKILGADSICNGNVITYTDSVTTGIWSVSNTTLATISSTGVLTTIAPGRDTIYYTRFAGGDSNRVMHVLRIDDAPAVQPITGASNICVAGVTTLHDTTTFGVWASSDTTKARISGSGVVTGVAVGTATITYTFTNSCGSAFDTALMHVLGLPVAGTITGPSTVCPGATITLSDTASGGAWSSDSTSRATVSTTGVVTGVSVGHPTIIYTVSNICGTTNASHPVTVTSAVTAGGITGASAVCVGATTGFADTITGGTWSSSASTIASVSTTGLISGLSPGSATISYSVSSSCGSAVATRAITVNPAPVAGGITGLSSVCLTSSPSTTLHDTSTTGSWSSSNPSVATITSAGVLTGLMSGITTIVYTVTNSCGTDTANMAFAVDSTAYAGTVSGATNICIGTPSTFTVTAAGGTWSSSNSAIASVTSAGVVNGASPGPATISYTVNNACGTANATKSVSVFNVPTNGTISGTTTFCAGTTSALSITTSGGAWSSRNTAIATVGAGSGVVTGVAGGSVVVLYTNSNSCGAAIDSVALTITPAANAGTISGSSSVCLGGTTTFTPTVSGGTWSSVNSAVATVNGSGVVTGVSAGSTTIHYSVTNICGTANTGAAVNVITIPVTGAITGVSQVCVAATITQASTPSGGTWRMTNGRATISGTGVVTGSAAGLDTVMYILGNTCGSDTAVKSIQVLPLPDTGVIVGPNVVCVGSAIFLTDTAAGAWSVSFGGTHASVSSTGMVTGLSGGAATIRYTVTNASCGSLFISHPVVVTLPADAGTLAGKDTICAGTLDTLTGGYGVSWVSTNTALATVDASGIVTGITAGDVTIYNIDSNSCSSDTARFAIHINPGSPSPGIITGIDSACRGMVVLYSNTVAGGTWASSNTVVASISGTGNVTAVGAGAVLISYTTVNSCGSSTITHPFRVANAPALTSQITASICDSSLLNYAATSDSAGVTLNWTRPVVPFISNAAGTGTGNIAEYLNSTADSVVHVTYMYTTTLHGCTDTTNVVVSVKPNPRLTSPLTDTVCSNAPFVYVDSESTGAGTTALWVRTANSAITPTNGNGAHNIHETLINSTLGNVTVNYVYSLLFDGCSTTQNVAVTIQPSPGGPQITTHSPGAVCRQTDFQNFGTANPPPTGVDYTWSAVGAQVWATGTTRQYCLVNFNSPGPATIYLLASLPGNNCPSVTSYRVETGTSVSDKPEVVFFNNDFVCLANNMDTYQWGYDDVATLDSTMLPGETNQNYTNTNADFTHNYYWVITTHGDCMQKSYYNTPLAVTNINAANSGSMSIVPNPNSGSFKLRLATLGTEKATVVISNSIGQKVKEFSMNTNEANEIVLDEAAGVYFITANTKSERFSAKVVLTK